MRNLKPFNGNTSNFLDEVIVSKRNSQLDPTYKQRINLLAPGVKQLYRQYDIAHDENSHVGLVPYGYVNQDKSDLIKLYTSSNKMLIKLKNNVTTVLDNRAMNTCQYCTIGPIGSLDHIVPKEEFPEFSVNPKNLIPACTTCNSHKYESWKLNNKTIFLNLYTDILPSEQYLFVDLLITPNNIQPTFELKNINNIDANFFELLKSHYSRLNLQSRFKMESHKIISELTNIILASRQLLDGNQLKDLVSAKLVEDKNVFGNNYYKSILEEALINSQGFVLNILT